MSRERAEAYTKGISVGAAFDTRVKINEILAEKEEAEWRKKHKGVPDAPQHVYGPENGFYGHYLPQHFKKTRIIDTHGK